MKTITIFVPIFLLTGICTAQAPHSSSALAQGQLAKQPLKMQVYSQQAFVTLLNNTKDILVFQVRYESPAAQWATYQLKAGERKALSVKGTYLSLFMTNTNKQALTYSLAAGNNYQFYWSVPRGMYDVDLIR